MIVTIKLNGGDVIAHIDNNTAAPGTKPLLPLWLFFCLSLVASWAIWLSPVEKQGSFYIVFLGLRFDFPFTLTKLVIGNCIPGILAIICALFEGKLRLRQMMSSLVRWRVSLKWYILALALPSGVFWLSLGGMLLYLPSPHALPSPSRFVQNLLLILPFGPLWEELAWRAYALRKLQGHYSQFTSALVLGLYWAIWHIPLWLVSLGLNGASRVPVLFAGIIIVLAWSVVFTFLYNQSGQSLPVVILLHAAYLSASGQVFGVVAAEQLRFIGLSAVLSVCLAAAFAVGLRREFQTDHTSGTVLGAP